MAGELPSAPSSVVGDVPGIEMATPMVQTNRVVDLRTEHKVVDKKFIAFAVVSTGSTFADSYTTLFARENWLAGDGGPRLCGGIGQERRIDRGVLLHSQAPQQILEFAVSWKYHLEPAGNDAEHDRLQLDLVRIRLDSIGLSPL
jgi:hypothetical protein